jgi:hypothetical protein
MTSIASLFGAIGNAPNLSGAACVGESDLFDEVDDPSCVELACSICARCPAIRPCKEYSDSLPDNSLHGVIGGRLHVWKKA